jgi:hypothetical protein
MISAIITLTFPKLSAATIIPQIAAPRRTKSQPQQQEIRKILRQNIHNRMNPDRRPQLFKHQADPKKMKKNRTAKIILGTPLAIRNVILSRMDFW